MSFLPSERTIQDRLEERCKPAAGILQKIGEDFLAIRSPSRYRGLRPQGRNADLQTTKGYPDAYAKQGAALHVVEATVGDWRKHLEQEDAERLQKLEGVASYVLFVLKPAEALIAQSNASEERKTKDEDHYKDLLASHGVPRDEIEFIFIDQLIRELRSTQYAPILRDLGLPLRLDGFERVVDIPEFEPTRPKHVEYRSRQVVSPKRLDRTYAMLDRHRLLILDGLGGVGKTTIGIALAYRWMDITSCDGYYMDARSRNYATDRSATDVVQAMEMFADTRTLFVIDNVHVMTAQEIARILAVALERGAPQLIMLGRNFPSGVLACRSATERAQIGTETLVVERDDLLAMYRLLARRVLTLSPPPEPDAVELDAWLKHAPDLVLFGSAIQHQMYRVRAGMKPMIARNTAVSFVHNRYLVDLPDAERHALIAIAKLAELEIPASLRSIGGIEPASLLKRELIMRIVSPDAPSARFSLPHDKLGDLILDSVDSKEVEGVWQRILDLDVFQAAFISRRLIEAGRVTEAADILRLLHDRIWQFSDDFPPSFAHAIDELYLRAGLNGAYRSNLRALLQAFVDRHENFLNGAGSFLRFVRKTGESQAEFVSIYLGADPDRLEMAVKLAPPHDVVQLLQPADTPEADAATAMKMILLRDDVMRSFGERLASASPDDINNAFLLLKQHAEQIHQSLERLLADAACLDPLLDRVEALMRIDVHRLLKLRHLVEFLAASPFRARLLSRVSCGTSYLSRLLLRDPQPGPNTRALVNDALSEMNPEFAFASQSSKRRAAMLQLIMLGAREDKVLSRYIRHLGDDETICALMRFWYPETFIAVWDHLCACFGNGVLPNRMRNLIHRTVARRLDACNLRPEQIIRLAGMRYLCHRVRLQSSASTAHADTLLKARRGALQAEWARHQTTDPKNKFYYDALSFAVGLT